MKNIRELIADFLNEIGDTKISIVEKESSFLMRAIGFIFASTKINPRFMTAYLTTIGNRVYVPKAILNSGDPRRLLDGIIHETVHARDFQKSPILFVLGYLFPQILCLLFVFATLAVVNIYFLFFLLALLFLLPFPAYWRMLLELRAYRTSIIYAKVIYGYNDSSMDLIYKWIINQLSTSNYYFTWPFTSHLKKLLRDENALRDPIYVQIENFLLKHKEEINQAE